MIKLTLNPHTHPKEHLFDKPVVIIGASSSPDADLSLPQEKLEPCHLKIMQHGSKFVAINLANDPFVTINGIPFGKKTIRSQDLLEIGTTQISFEGTIIAPAIDRGLADTEVKLPAILDKVLTHKEQEAAHPSSTSSFQSSFEPMATPLFEETAETPMDLEEEMRLLDAWLQETLPEEPEQSSSLSQEKAPFSGEEEDLDDEESIIEADPILPLKPSAQPLPATPPSKAAQKQTIKDLYFKDYEDDAQPHISAGKIQQPPAKTIDWHTLWIIILGIISTITIVALLLYANASGKSEDEELKAAEAVSDVAMALAYAQFKNITPQNQNWSDPDFIRNNLTAVLAQPYHPLAQLDSHGQLTNSPYLLRIYTSSDLSDFLIIAQPAPSVLQWLIPKSAILVYSKDMELRKITDLKSLNRLLVNPTLDGSVATDVANTVKKADLITLSSIVKRQHRLGFAPPKALALIRPGAENRIYNAPRYYSFGEAIMDKAVQLSENQENTNEIVLLQNEIEALQRFPNIVLYSSQGMQSAIDAQKSLTLFEPKSKILIAYLQFNTHGHVQSSHILMDDGTGELAFKDNAPPKYDKHRQENAADSQARIADNQSISQADLAHPLFFQLSALSSARQQALKPIGDELISLIETENHNSLPRFKEKLQDIVDRYLAIQEEQQTKIDKGLAKLYQEYPSMPLTDFMHYVQASGLESVARESLKKLEARQQNETISEDAIALQLQRIKDSTTLSMLEEEVARASNLFTLKNIPNLEKVTALQNSVKTETQNKLDALIFSSNSTLPPGSFNSENRSILVRILKEAWIKDQEEADYYLSEFDLLIHKNPSPIAENEAPTTSSVETTAPLKDYHRFWQKGNKWSKGSSPLPSPPIRQ